jgi:hypothetical protein
MYKNTLDELKRKLDTAKTNLRKIEIIYLILLKNQNVAFSR